LGWPGFSIRGPSPGTGDVALSLAQIAGGANLVIVTTPQVGAYVVASRIAEMAKKVSINIIGVIENMSYFLPMVIARNIFSVRAADESFPINLLSPY